MAQAQAARAGRLGTSTRRPRLGLLSRLRAVAAVCADRSRQRRELSGYLARQALGRQTGTRG